MSKDEKENDIILDLNFAPSWARSSPNANLQRLKKSDRFENGEDEDFQRRGRDKKGGGHDHRQRRDFDDRPPRDSDRRPSRDFDRDRKGPRSDMPRPESRGAVVDFGHPARPGPGPRPQFRDDRRDDSRGDDRRRPNDGGGYRPRDREPPQQPALPLDVRVLPEQKALGAIIRRIQTSHRAFPLRDIAWLFLDNPNSCLIRIEPLKDQPMQLFQCKVCGYPALSEEEIRGHLVNRHLEDFFDAEDVDCEPPSGSFNCVARCSLSGELLGPPNHHSFAAKVQEMLRTRYATLSEEAYRSRIEMVRDTEAIETWRQQCTKKKVYRRKGAAIQEEPPAPAGEGGEDAAAETAAEPPPKAPALTREVAELVFMREIVPAQLTSAKHLICTAGVATQTSSRPLGMMLRDMLSRERRFPASLFFALRGAFRHRKLYLFRTNDPKGIDFVMLKTPSVLDATHTVKILQDILTHVEAHPACTKVELVTALGGAEEVKRKEVLIQLAWLVERGHVIEFYNDVLSIPREFPAFRLLPGEKGYQGPRPSASAQQAAAPAAPAAPAEEPAVPAEEPVATAEEPVVEAEPPAVETEPPPEAEAEAPAAPAEEIAVPAEVPTVSAEAPVATAEEPVVEAEPPAVEAEPLPEVAAEAPVVPAEEPAVPAEEIAVPAEVPIVSAEEPVATAEEPAVEAEPPAVEAEEPVAAEPPPEEAPAETPAVPAEEIAAPAEVPTVSAEEPAVEAEPVVVADAEAPAAQPEEAAAQEPPPAPE